MVRVIPLIDRGPKAKRIAVMAGLFLIFFSLLLFAVLNTYFLYAKEGQPGLQNMIKYNTTSGQPDATVGRADFSGKDFLVDVELLDMKPEKSELSLSANVTRLRYTKQKGTLLLGSYNTVALNRSMYFMDKKITLELTNGDLYKYPFDEYITEVPFAGYVGASKDLVKYITNATDVPPPEFQYAIIARGNLHNWKFYLKWDKHDRLQGINILKIRIKRSRTVRFFSIFIVSLMWLVSIGGFLIALQVIVRDHKMIPWNISVFSALLFAMPRLRNVQPNIPPIGTLADTIGLFFNMALISLCQISMMIRWMLQIPGPSDVKEEEKDMDEKEKEKRKKERERDNEMQKNEDDNLVVDMGAMLYDDM